MAAEVKLVRIQEKGQVTLPADIRRRLGLTLEDMIERGRVIRGQLLYEQYGIVDSEDT